MLLSFPQNNQIEDLPKNMGKIYNHSRFKDRRRELRCNQTDAEKALWQNLRNRNCCGVKFFRQYSVGCYIVDFYSPSLKLAIELDGGQHTMEENQVYDAQRTAYLEGMGIDVLRFWNNEVLQNLDGVVEKVLDKVEEKRCAVGEDNSP